MDAATVSVWLLNTLLLGCALYALVHPAERATVARGWAALRVHLGDQLIAVCLGIAALFLWAVIEHLGLLVGVAVALALLLAVRAHDLGALTPEPTELDNDVPPHSFAAARAGIAAYEESLRADDFVRQAHDRYRADDAAADFVQKPAADAPCNAWCGPGCPHAPARLTGLPGWLRLAWHPRAWGSCEACYGVDPVYANLESTGREATVYRVVP